MVKTLKFLYSIILNFLINLDTYSIKDNIGNRIFINENNISIYGYNDINYQRNKNSNVTQWINVENGKKKCNKIII